jgi:hypothetical protein
VVYIVTLDSGRDPSLGEDVSYIFPSVELSRGSSVVDEGSSQSNVEPSELSSLWLPHNGLDDSTGYCSVVVLYQSEEVGYRLVVAVVVVLNQSAVVGYRVVAVVSGEVGYR